MKHFVVIKFNQGIDVPTLLPSVRELYSGALSLPGVERVEVFICSPNLPNRYDMLIEMSLTREGLHLFQGSEIYKSWEQQYDALIEKETVLDCE